MQLDTLGLRVRPTALAFIHALFVLGACTDPVVGGDGGRSPMDSGSREDAGLAERDGGEPRACGGPGCPAAGATIVSVAASAEDGDNVATNVIDGDLDTRWSGRGIGQTLVIELSCVSLVSEVRIATYLGDERMTYFDLEASCDGSTWQPLLVDGQNSGTTTDLETFAVPPTYARFVRLVGKGSSLSDWNSYTEIQIGGVSPTCIPSSAECGPDGCGGDHGSCPGSQSCVDGTCTTTGSDVNIIFSQDFDDDTLGPYDHAEWVEDWFAVGSTGGSIWENRQGECEIIAYDGNPCMRATYPMGSVGPSAGGFQWQPLIESGHSEIYFSYNVLFRPGFDWVQGGKLPGVGGRPDDYGPGTPPGYASGFSDGTMWGWGYGGNDDLGAVYHYLYYQDQSGPYGDTLRWGTFTFDVSTEQWVNLTRRVVLNTVDPATGGNHDGILESYVNGVLVATETGLRFRNREDIYIDYLKIYSHFGGSGPEYGAARDEWVLFDDFVAFEYAAGADVPHGNVPSPAGRVLSLPNWPR